MPVSRPQPRVSSRIAGCFHLTILKLIVAPSCRGIADARAGEVEMNGGKDAKRSLKLAPHYTTAIPVAGASVGRQAFQKRSHLAQNERLITDEEVMIGARHLDHLDRCVGGEQAANSLPA
jgi:hypothetical protein